MPVAKPKLTIIYDSTSNYIYPLLRDIILNNGNAVNVISSTAGGTPYTFDALKDNNIIFLCKGTLYTNAEIQLYKDLWAYGVNIFECVCTADTARENASMAINFGAASAITHSSNIDLGNYIYDEGYGIAKKSGLAYDKSAFYAFRTASGTGCMFSRAAGVKTLTTITTTQAYDTSKAILMPKGMQSLTYASTPAHYIGFGDLFSGSPSVSFSNVFQPYFLSILNFLLNYYIVKGTVKTTTGTPVVRDLYFYLRSDGSYIGKTTSDASGNFSLQLGTSENIYIVAKSGDSETQATVVYDKISPLLNLYNN